MTEHDDQPGDTIIWITGATRGIGAGLVRQCPYAGATMINACFQPLHSLDNATQKSGSPRRNLGRATALLYTVSCWRRARFSRASCRWPPQRNGKSRSRASSVLIIRRQLSPGQSREINHLAGGWSFGEGQPPGCPPDE